MKMLKRFALLAVATALVPMAHATDPSAPDASGIVDTATTTFDTVGALIASIVGFFIIVKVVKWIRK